MILKKMKSIRLNKRVVQALAVCLGIIFLTVPSLELEGKEPQKAEVTVNDVPVISGKAEQFQYASYVTPTEEKYGSLQEFAINFSREITYVEPYAVETEYVENSMWTTERSELIQEGREGEKAVTANVTYDGIHVVEKEVTDIRVTRKAQPEIIEIGTNEPAEYIKPIEGARFSSGFGPRWGRSHKGVDWACDEGTSVYAAKDGVVELARENGGYGNCIYINHGDGTLTRYGHLKKIQVKAGDKILQGDQIALSGNTGRSTGPHLHFEILIGGEQVDPLEHISK